MAKYQCENCDKLFVKKYAYEIHVNRKNPCTKQIANSDNVCSQCDKQFSTYFCLYQHIKNNICGKKKKIKGKIPKKIKELTWYKYIGKDKGVGLCLCCNVTEICQMSFHCGHVISEVNGGEIKVDNMRPICSGCNGSMGTMNMNDFVKKFKLEGKIIEPINDEFINVIASNITLEKIKPAKYKDIDGKVIHTCNKCGKYFNQKSNFTRHINRKNPCNEQISNKTNKCNSCGKMFCDGSSLIKHVKSKTCTSSGTINNIHIANIKNDHVVMYDGKKWNINKGDVFKDIIYVKSDFVCMKLKEQVGRMIKIGINK